MLKLFSGNTFIDRPSGREAETRRGSLIVVVFVCVCAFVLSLQTFCFYSSCSERCFYSSCSERFDFYQRSQRWHWASGFALHLLRSLIFRGRCWRMGLGVSCILRCTISVTHTHLAPLCWCTPSLFVLLWTWQGASLGRLPQPRVQYVQWILRQFFFFLSCVVFFFSNYCLTTVVVVAVLFFCFFRGLRGLASWSLGGSALRWEADNGKVCVVFFFSGLRSTWSESCWVVRQHSIEAKKK